MSTVHRLSEYDEEDRERGELRSVQSSAVSEFPALLTTQEVSRILRVKPKTVYNWAYTESAPLRPVRIRNGKKGLLRWRREEVVALLEDDRNGVG